MTRETLQLVLWTLALTALAVAAEEHGGDHGDSHASVECYGLAVGINDRDGPMKGNLYGGRYLDEFEKRDGEWRISKRKYIMDWTLPLPEQPDGSPRPEFPLHMLDLTKSGHPEYRSM